MSDRIQYEIQVLDKFSANLKKFDRLIAKNNLSIKKFSSSLTKINFDFTKFGKGINISKPIKDINRLEKSFAKLSNINKSFNFTKLNNGFGSMAKNISAMEASMLNLAKANERIIRRQGSFIPQAQSKVNRIQSTGQRNANSYIGSGPGYLGINRQERQYPRSPFLSGNNTLSSFGGMAKAMGYYSLIDKGIQFPGTVYNNLKMTRGIEASFDAYKKLGIAPDLGLPKKELRDVMGISDKYGVKFQDLIDPYRQMLATKGLNAPTTKKLLGGVAAYSNIVGMGSEAQKSTYRALEQMLTQQQIRGQEFNLQLQQAPGFRQMFYKAFLKAIKVQGIKSIKGEVNEENVGEKFAEYREKGLMESSVVIKHLADILNDPMLQKMGIAKGHMVQGEENRFANAYFKMTSAFGDVVEGPIKSSLIKLTDIFNNFSLTLKENELMMRSITKAFSEMFKVVGGTLGGMTKVAGYAVKTPYKIGEIATTAGYALTGNIEPLKQSLGGGATPESQFMTHEQRAEFARKKLREKGFGLRDPYSILSDREKESLNMINERIPKTSQVTQEQVIKVILEGKNMPVNMTATVENYGAKTTNMRVENNVGSY